MERWPSIVKKVRDKVSLGIVPAKKHHARFGPATANGFRKMIGLPEVVREGMKQQSLSEF